MERNITIDAKDLDKAADIIAYAIVTRDPVHRNKMRPALRAVIAIHEGLCRYGSVTVSATKEGK